MADDHADPRFRPIIYVRGFAGSEDEIDDTVADPYMGFNLGATKFRQDHGGAVRRHYFESPLIRLIKDFEYRDVYSDGAYMPLDERVPDRPIVIYRYYDSQFFDQLDDDDELPQIRPKQRKDEDEVLGKRRDIEDFAAGLGKLILRLRTRYLDSKAPQALKDDFKVHLVGHSMGGLIIRSFLQHVGQGGKAVRDRFSTGGEKQLKEAKSLVDRVFTYATPHNGIEFSILGNVPSFFTAGDVDNFNRKRMAQYLGLAGWSVNQGLVNNLRGRFPADRFFTLIGTNHEDYAVLYGWSRRLVGPMSDGLVRVKNAGLHSRPTANSKTEHAPRAFVHRSHSGHYGIVNSEEGYQNLARFLFGDVRVDCKLDVEKITLPIPVQEEKDAGRQIRASYHVECAVAARGISTELHRRQVADGSAVFRTYDELVGNNNVKKRMPTLFSLFLRSAAQVSDDDPGLGFVVTLAVKIPEYVVDRTLWFDRHFEGDNLLEETIHIVARPPDPDATTPRKDWTVDYGFARLEEQHGVPNETATLKHKAGTISFTIPLDSTHRRPGLKGKLIFTARNHE